MNSPGNDIDAPVGKSLQVIRRSELHLLGEQSGPIALIDDVGAPWPGPLENADRIESHHDLRAYIDQHRKPLIESYLDRVDRFVASLQSGFRSQPFSSNLLLFHVTSKRTDLHPSFLRHCIASLVDDIANSNPGRPIETRAVIPANAGAGPPLASRLRMVLLASRFLLTLFLVRLILGGDPDKTRFANAEFLFYTQFNRHPRGEYENVNYGSVFNDLASRYRCLYVLSVVADGHHVPGSITRHLRLARIARKSPEHVWVLERIIGFRFLARLVLLWKRYVWGVLRFTPARLASASSPLDRWVFETEIGESLERAFNYAHVLELSQALASKIDGPTFVYYLFDHNYGKLLGSCLHARAITVGCQHGTSSHLRLGPYFSPSERRMTPYPHFIFLEGENHRLSMEWIVPGESSRLVVVGAPRVDDLPLSSGPQRSTTAPVSTPRVLVILSLHGNLDVLDPVVSVISDHADARFLIKPHPAATGQREQARHVLSAADAAGEGVRWELRDGDLYALASSVDYVLFTDSSAGIEVATCGVVPLYFDPGHALNLCPLVDIELFKPEMRIDSQRIRSAHDLRSWIERDSIPNVPSGLPEFYFANLGDARRRWVECLEDTRRVSAE
jgi:hypothetical protein